MLANAFGFAAGAFCELMFLEPKMKIYVQGSEVETRPLLSDLHEPQKTDVNIDRFLTAEDKEYCAKHGRSPYSVTVHVSGPICSHNHGSHEN